VNFLFYLFYLNFFIKLKMEFFDYA